MPSAVKNLYDWGFWLGAAALIVSVGRFLDEYHIRSDTKSKARDLLIRAFFYLETINLPDIGRRIARRIRAFGSRFGWIGVIGLWLLGVLMLATFFTITGARSYSLRGQHSPLEWMGHYVDLFGSSIFNSVFNYGVVSLTPLFAGIAGWLLLRLITDTKRDSLALITALLSPLAIIISILPIGLFVGLTGWGGTYGLAVWFFFSGFLIVPFLFLAAILIILIAGRSLLQALRFVAMRMFDAASEPTRSPFVYGCAFLSVLVLFVKLLLGLNNA
jgi:hypothetical protein